MIDKDKSIIFREELIDKVSASILNIRKDLKLTQVEFANILGLSKNTIVRVERTGSRLSWCNVIAIIVLFSNTKVIQKILNGKDMLTIITACSFNYDGECSNSGDRKITYTFPN